MLETRGNMGQCKSKHRGFKSYANAVFRHGYCLSASLRANNLREIKENMGQSVSKERDFKEQKRRKTLEVKF
jgi:hypothetical protein